MNKGNLNFQVKKTKASLLFKSKVKYRIVSKYFSAPSSCWPYFVVRSFTLKPQTFVSKQLNNGGYLLGHVTFLDKLCAGMKNVIHLQLNLKKLLLYKMSGTVSMDIYQ